MVDWAKSTNLLTNYGLRENMIHGIAEIRSELARDNMVYGIAEIRSVPARENTVYGIAKIRPEMVRENMVYSIAEIRFGSGFCLNCREGSRFTTLLLRSGLSRQGRRRSTVLLRHIQSLQDRAKTTRHAKIRSDLAKDSKSHKEF